jgi:hypothetical protein
MLNYSGKRDWLLAGTLIYETDVAQMGPTILVPVGFVTDFASVPRFVPRWIVDVNEEHVYAAIVHDFLCRTGLLKDRHLADEVFREAMKVCGVYGWKRWLMWAAVRGVTAWLQATRRSE